MTAPSCPGSSQLGGGRGHNCAHRAQNELSGFYKLTKIRQIEASLHKSLKRGKRSCKKLRRLEGLEPSPSVQEITASLTKTNVKAV